ncbi:MAG TPA: molybdopterin molybdotransferase MoeA [Opitutaceae bacterium]
MLTPEAAEALIFETLPTVHREDCPLSDAHGRILRADLTADRDLPPFDRVTMDGFAVRASALAKGIARFRVGGTQAAGMRPFSLGPDEQACIEIMTGAVLPEGADCVVPYEDAKREGDWAVLAGGNSLGAGQNVHRRGSDHRAGTVVVRAGVRLSGREIAVAAACGHAVLTVSHSPRVAILSTGDELVEVDGLVAPHQIRRSNDYALRAALIRAGYPRADRFHLRDIRHEIEHMLWHVLAEYDAVLITGGVSKGKFDFLPAELERQGVRKILHGVAQRPGKPFWFGMGARLTPVFALPGNPVSAYTCLHRYVLPALDHAGGLEAQPLLRAALAEPVALRANLAWLLPVRISSGPRAELVASPGGVATSGDFGGLVETDGFLELPASEGGFPAGHMAPFRPWV